MTKLARAVVFTLGTSLAFGALPVAPAFAGPAEEATAESLYKEGKTQYEIGEYEQALELWKQAYAKVDDTADNLQVRHALVYNIAEAEVKVFEITQDITHLRRGKTLLDRYLSNHQKLYGDSADASRDRADAQSKLKEIDAMLAEAEANAPAATATPVPAAGESKPADSGGSIDLAAAKLARKEQIKNDPKLRNKDKLYTGLIWGGGVVTVVGGVMLIASPFVGVSTAVNNTLEDPTSFGFDGTGGAVAGAGVLLAAGGVAALISGVVLRKKHRRPTKEQMSFVPYGNRTGFGGAATIHF